MDEELREWELNAKKAWAWTEMFLVQVNNNSAESSHWKKHHPIYVQFFCKKNCSLLIKPGSAMVKLCVSSLESVIRELIA